MHADLVHTRLPSSAYGNDAPSKIQLADPLSQVALTPVANQNRYPGLSSQP